MTEKNFKSTIFAILFIATHLINTPANAQFKCEIKGKTSFQDTPCDTAAKSSKLIDWSGAAPSPAVATPGIANCQAALSTQGFFDPGSVQILSTTKAGMEVITYADVPTTAKKFMLMVNAKNRYGGYVGAKAYTCYTSEDENRVLSFR
jgi:hypothetical protein